MTMELSRGRHKQIDNVREDLKEKTLT